MIRGSCLCGQVRFELDGAPQFDQSLPLLHVPQGAWGRLRQLPACRWQRISLDCR